VSAISLLLLGTAVTAAVVGSAALHSVRGVRRRLDGLLAGGPAMGPGARPAASAVPKARKAASCEEIRSIVMETLAEERERELAEARAFWAVQDTRESGPDEDALADHGAEYEIAPFAPGVDAAPSDMPGPGIFVPRQLERDIEPALDISAGTAPEEAVVDAAVAETADAESATATTAEHPENAEHSANQNSGPESPEVAAARRRHPSDPDFTIGGEPVAGHEGTVGRLARLADTRTPLADVRQGPLGRLDVYLFQDGTTVCLSPGHRETAEALCAALRAGEVPVLMGGSTVSGAFALTFAYGEGRTAYLLADRVIASR
jgi:hypothetical protein